MLPTLCSEGMWRDVLKKEEAKLSNLIHLPAACLGLQGPGVVLCTCYIGSGKHPSVLSLSLLDNK